MAPKTKGSSSSSSSLLISEDTQSELNLVRDIIKKSANFESKTEKEKVPRRKYGAHSGIKFKFEKPVIQNSAIFKSRTDRGKGNATTICTVTMHTAENKTYNKEESTDSGMGKCILTLEEDEKFARVRQIDETTDEAKSMKNIQDDSKILTESEIEGLYSTVPKSLRVLRPQTQASKISTIPKAKSMENVQDDSKIFTESEIEGLCSTVAASLRVLQPQRQTSKTSKSQSCNKLNPPSVTPNTSKLPILNAQQISSGQPAELEETTSPARQKTFQRHVTGFHAGLRFSFNGKNAKPLDFKFKSRPSLPKNECFKDDKHDPVF